MDTRKLKSEGMIDGSPPKNGEEVCSGDIVLELTAGGKHADLVVSEVAKAVRAALDELHLSMEALCNSVVLGKSPHAGNGFRPGAQRVGQGDERLEPAGCEPVDEVQELASQRAALSFSSVLLIEKIAQPVHLLVERFEDGVELKEIPKTPPLCVGQF